MMLHIERSLLLKFSNFCFLKYGEFITYYIQIYTNIYKYIINIYIYIYIYISYIQILYMQSILI